MFHLDDLFDGAVASVWRPTTLNPGQELVQRVRRRRYSSQPGGSPELRLPDAKYLESLADTVTSAGCSPDEAAALINACLETPALRLASSRDQDGEITWRRLALLTDIGRVALLRVGGQPGRKGVVISNVSLATADLSDLSAVRLFVAEIYVESEGAVECIKDRGRKTAPWAVLLGAPELPTSWHASVEAVAAMSGYRLEAFPQIKRHLRPAQSRIAVLEPEAALVWSAFAPPGDFARRVEAGPGNPTVSSIETTDPRLALEAISEFFQGSRVQARVEDPTTTFRTLADAAIAAQEQTTTLVFTPQALKRAAASSFERPDEVFVALIELDQVARLYASDSLPGPFEDACEQRGLFYASDISESTLAKHKARYEITVDGVKHTMGPHLKFGGSWNPRYCARVYWWRDAVNRRLVVGHIGEHLPGSKD